MLSVCIVSSRNAAHIYENALAMLAFMARGTEGDWERAKMLADSFVYAQSHDRYFDDRRLRNVYRSGDLEDEVSGKARLPGWWDYKNEEWYEDKYHVSSYTGNLAWVMIALLKYYEEKGVSEYLKAAEGMGNWIYEHCYDCNGEGRGGYTGGLLGWEPSSENPQEQTKIGWKSTEHNLDVYVAFYKLYELTDNEEWNDRANCAKKFVEAMWNEEECHFWTGTLEDGESPNKDVVPADIQTWGLMVLCRNAENHSCVEKYGCGIDWVEEYCNVDPCPTCNDWKGFDFSYDFTNEQNNKDGVWWEGTSHMCVAYQIKCELVKSYEFIEELRRVQESSNNSNDKGIVAACHDGLTTGFTTACESPDYPDGQCPWYYFNRLHVGATVWYIFSEREHNPYWQIASTDGCKITTTTTTTTIWSWIYDEMWGTRKEEHLHLLRTFRDDVLADNEVGRDYIFMLYSNSLEILTLLVQNPALTKDLREVIEEFLPGIQSIINGGRMVLPKKQLTNVESLLTAFEPKASLELKTVISKVKKDIQEGTILRQLRINIIE